jgi:hypothetical protein
VSPGQLANFLLALLVIFEQNLVTSLRSSVWLPLLPPTIGCKQCKQLALKEQQEQQQEQQQWHAMRKEPDL